MPEYKSTTDLAKYLMDETRSNLTGFSIELRNFKFSGRSGKRAVRCTMCTVAKVKDTEYRLHEQTIVFSEDENLIIDLPKRTFEINP